MNKSFGTGSWVGLRGRMDAICGGEGARVHGRRTICRCEGANSGDGRADFRKSGAILTKEVRISWSLVRIQE